MCSTCLLYTSDAAEHGAAADVDDVDPLRDALEEDAREIVGLVGQDHKPWLAEEIGPVGVELLRAVKERLDPQGVLNPGVLVP